MLYLWLKYLHILSSTILFGTGIGTACTMLYAHYTRDVHVMAFMYRYVVLADWLFTATSAIMQPLTGLWMMWLAGYSWHMMWIWGGLVGYLIAALCWFPVVYLQIKMRDMTQMAFQQQQTLPPTYYRYFHTWFVLGWPAFISLIIVFYLMTMKTA